MHSNAEAAVAAAAAAAAVVVYIGCFQLPSVLTANYYSYSLTGVADMV